MALLMSKVLFICHGENALRLSARFYSIAQAVLAEASNKQSNSGLTAIKNRRSRENSL